MHPVSGRGADRQFLGEEREFVTLVSRDSLLVESDREGWSRGRACRLPNTRV